MFGVRKQKVEIVNEDGNKEVYNVGPLTGEYLEDLYFVMEKFQAAGTDEAELLKALGSSASTRLHKIVYATLELSYPDIDKNTLNHFVTQNLMKFIEAIIKVNLPPEE